MPSHKLHVYVDKVLFGKSYRKLHEALDRPYWVLGRKHRIVFHDGWSASEVAKKVCPGDPVALEAAAAHVLLDELCSNDREFKMQLSLLANLNSRGRKRGTKKRAKGKKKKKPTSTSLKSIEKFAKQALMIQKLHQLLHS